MDTIDHNSLRKGEERSWRKLFEVYYVIMCQVAYQYLKDSFTAETMVEDVICRLWERREALNIDGTLKSYLLQSVRNSCLDYLRSFHVKNLVALPSEEYLDDRVLDGSYPLGQLISDEFEAKVQKVIDTLPEETRTVFIKSREEGLKYKDIALEQGISVNTVKYHIKKALSAIRGAMEQ